MATGRWRHGGIDFAADAIFINIEAEAENRHLSRLSSSRRRFGAFAGSSIFRARRRIGIFIFNYPGEDGALPA